MTEPTDKKPEQTPPTAEQIAKMKANMLEHYTAQIDFLRIQAEYEELQARVMIARANRAKAEVTLAQIYAPQEEVEEPVKPEAPVSPKAEDSIAESKSTEPIIRKLKFEVTPEKWPR